MHPRWPSLDAWTQQYLTGECGSCEPATFILIFNDTVCKVTHKGSWVVYTRLKIIHLKLRPVTRNNRGKKRRVTSTIINLQLTFDCTEYASNAR